MTPTESPRATGAVFLVSAYVLIIGLDLAIGRMSETRLLKWQATDRGQEVAAS